jgi:CBS domain containing-hemolysin-like protein
MLKAREVPVTAVMTPRTVLFSLNQDTTVSEFAQQYMLNPFARIPIYQDKSDDIVGYVLRNDILVSEKVKPHKTLKKLKKQILAIPETVKLLALFDLLMKKNMQLALVVDEYGSTLGLITIEDIIESLLGLEIVDSKDPAVDMQHLARRKWQQRMQQKGIVLSEDEQKVPHSQQTKPKD